ncbi:MAG: polyprenyl diphosphate synthase [Thermoleophilia bacterium]|jgi:undecaprenyl diphosphate synthase
MTILTRWRSARALLGLGREPEPRRSAADSEVPRSVAVIMDGNGRWARERHLPVGAGHRAGARALKRVVRAAGDAGIEDLTIYSFSTENWSRPVDEVDDLMSLFRELIDREIGELHAEGVQVRFVGRIDRLDPALRERIARAEEQTAANTRLRLFIAMNYGGRQEIVDAARRFAAEFGPEAGEEEFARCLYAPEMRDPELVIRTSGERRLSNFLLWQSAYAELYFSERMWPDFDGDALREALDDYAGRQRRFGGREPS